MQQVKKQVAIEPDAKSSSLQALVAKVLPITRGSYGSRSSAVVQASININGGVRRPSRFKFFAFLSPGRVSQMDC